MSSQEPTEFQLFFWEGGEEGSAFYSRNLGVLCWPLMDPAKHQLGSAIGKLEMASNWISKWQLCLSLLSFYRFA